MIFFRSYIRANFKIGYTYKVNDILTFSKILQKYLISTLASVSFRPLLIIELVARVVPAGLIIR